MLGIFESLRTMCNEKRRIREMCISQFCVICNKLKMTNARHRRKYSKFTTVDCKFFLDNIGKTFFMYFPVTPKWYAKTYARIAIMSTCVNKALDIDVITIHAHYCYDADTWTLSLTDIPKSLRAYPELKPFVKNGIEGKSLYSEISDVIRNLCYLHLC